MSRWLVESDPLLPYERRLSQSQQKGRPPSPPLPKPFAVPRCQLHPTTQNQAPPSSQKQPRPATTQSQKQTKPPTKSMTATPNQVIRIPLEQEIAIAFGEMPVSSTLSGSVADGTPQAASALALAFQPNLQFLSVISSGSGNGAGAKNSLSKEERLAIRRKKRAFAERRRTHSRKSAIESMRSRVQELQQQYDELCRAADQQLMRLHQSPSLSSSRILSEQSASDAMIVPPRRSLLLIAQEIDRLRRENVMIQELVDQKCYLWSTVQSIVEDYGEGIAEDQSCGDSEDSAGSSQAPRLTTKSASGSIDRPLVIPRRTRGQLNGFCYFPYTMNECHELIRQHLRQSDIASPTAPSANAPSQGIGWNGQRTIESSTQMSFDLHKSWPGNATEVFGRAWTFADQPQSLRRALTTPQHLEVLQKLSDDIMIFRRITENPRNGTINHSVYLMYRVRRGDGFWNGIVTLPLWGNAQSVQSDDPLGQSQLAANETYVAFQKMWLYAPEPGNKDRTLVRHWGVFDCENADDALFWKNEVVDATHRFEFLLLFPCVQEQTPLQS